MALEKEVCPQGMELQVAVEQANNCLLFRQFEDCLEVCHESISRAKNYAEDKRVAAAVEVLVVVAVQAYAELNRWLEVVPFVAQTYNGIEDCPPAIAQLCLSLHAKLKDDVTSTVIASIWLKNPNNFTLPDYLTVTEMYITRVLIPAQRWDEVRTFLDSCPGLSEATKDTCLRQVYNYRRKCDENRTEHKTRSLQNADCIVDGETTEDSENDKGVFIQLIQRIQRWVQTNKPFYSPYVIRSMYIVVLCLTFATLWKRGKLKSAVLRIWSVLAVLWRGMFGPLYMARR